MDDSAAPRDFRISSTSYECEGKYTKCPLCHSLKRVFYCVDCLYAGEFVHSTDIHAETFANKRARLVRTLNNKQLVEERCSKLLARKQRFEDLRIEQEKAKERIILMKLAIEQTRNNVLEKNELLSSLVNQNADIKKQFSNYIKCVTKLASNAEKAQDRLAQKVQYKQSREKKLASLRRLQIRQMCKYIFPMHVTITNLDRFQVEDTLLKDMNIIDQSNKLTEQLHIGSTSIPSIPSCPYITKLISTKKMMSDHLEVEANKNPIMHINAGLLYATQVTLFIAFVLNIDLPYLLKLKDMTKFTPANMDRLCICVTVLAAHASSAQSNRHSYMNLSSLYQISVDAEKNNFQLGSNQRWLVWNSNSNIKEAEAIKVSTDSDDEAPEHISWGEWDEQEIMTASSSPTPDMLTSRVSNATASIVSFLRGWAK